MIMKNEPYQEQLSKAIPHIFLSETTQREGRQAEGAHLSAIASIAHALLVNKVMGKQPRQHYLELNHPASNETFADIAREIAKMNLDLKVATHVRCTPRDVQSAIDTGLQYINTYIPIQPHSEQESLRSLNQALHDIHQITDMTRSSGIKELRVSVEHASELPLSTLQRIYGEISHTSGIARVGYAITNGFMLPKAFRDDIESIYEVLPPAMPLQIHVHNDTGLAVSYFNEVLDLISKNGRDVVLDCSVSGLGERNGILSLGDILAQLYLINPDELKKRFSLRNYAELFYHIEKNMRVPMSRHDPLNPYAFSHSAGPHLKGMKENNYQAIPPEEFGFSVRLNVGTAITGWEGIQFWAKVKLQTDLSIEEAKNLACHVRERAAVDGPFSEEDLHRLIQTQCSMRNVATFQSLSIVAA